MRRYSTPDELAEMFDKSREWVIGQCRRGQWPHSRVGIEYRFKPEHVESIEKSMEREARTGDATRHLPGVSPRSRSKYAKAPPT